MHETKARLIVNNGLKCMLCGKEVDYNHINWHHIRPKAVCKYYGEEIDNSYENGSLLCLDCHAYVHTLYYWSKEYQETMNVIKQHKK